MKVKLYARKSFWMAIGAIIATIVLQFTGLDLKPFIEPAAEVVTEVVSDSPALPETVTTTSKVSK